MASPRQMRRESAGESREDEGCREGEGQLCMYVVARKEEAIMYLFVCVRVCLQALLPVVVNPRMFLI